MINKRYIIFFMIALLSIVLVAFFSKQFDFLNLKNETSDRLEFQIPSTIGNLNFAELQNQTVFVFFGFTRCPQICPTTLTQLSSLFLKLSAAEKQSVKVLFISIDPENDSMEVLKKHMSRFGDSFIGATDSDENLQKITKLFGASYKRQPVIDHTSTIYVINKNQELVDVLPFTATTEELLQSYKTADRKPSILKYVQENYQVEVLAENKECDLSASACEIQYDSNKAIFTFSQQPILLQKPLTARFQILQGQIIPEALDIRGVELNMGYIHPSFKKIDEGVFEAELTLPVCELTEMNWLARVIIQKQKGEAYKALQFGFKTQR